MIENEDFRCLNNWSNEIINSLSKNGAFYIAVFSAELELLYANETIIKLLGNKPFESFLNPTIDNILNLDFKQSLIFEGYITFGDYFSVNTSILGQIYRKDNQFLLIGGIKGEQLVDQNKTLHVLNTEIINLQRQLIKEKKIIKITNDKLNILNQELTKLNNQKDLFLTILAHDLRNPFNALLGFSDLLLENINYFSIEKIEEMIKLINKTSYQTYFLLEDLLMWSKSQAGSLDCSIQRIDLFEINNEVLELLNQQAAGKNIQITQYIEPETYIYADVNMLRAVLRNLISNAIKFSQKNEKILVSTDYSKEDLIITISDTGVGISKEKLETIWLEGNNKSTEGTKGEKGTGFGLGLCKEFIEKMNGKIWVESEIGVGSDFKFMLPRSLNN